MRRFLLPTTAAIIVLAGCGGPQSIIDTMNPGAREIEGLWWIALVSTGLLSSIVVAGLFWAVRRALRAGGDPEPEGEALGVEARRREDRWILLLGGLAPALFLVGFLIVAVRTGTSVAHPPSNPTLSVEVIGHKFWWEITYPEHGIVTANEMHIPAGEPIEVRVTSADVIHSFWVPRISPGKIDMVPGRTNVIWMSADEPGEYRGQCTEFCGVQHALMSMMVIASDPEEFEGWIARRSQAPVPPDDPAILHGMNVFVESGCLTCHAVDGRERTAPAGSPGPDLFDLASRRTLGALTVENTRENLARFIVDPHTIKPGVRMPAHRLDEDDLSALVDYLESLGR